MRLQKLILLFSFIGVVLLTHYTVFADSSYEIPYTLGMYGVLYCDRPPYDTSTHFQSYAVGKTLENHLVEATTQNNEFCTGGFRASTSLSGHFNLDNPNLDGSAGVYYLTLYLDANWSEPYGYMAFDCPEQGTCQKKRITPYTTSRQQVFATISPEGVVDSSTFPTTGCSHNVTGSNTIATIYSLYLGTYEDTSMPAHKDNPYFPSYVDDCREVFRNYSLENTGHSTLGDGDYWLSLGANYPGETASSWNYYFLATREGGVWSTSSSTIACSTDCFSNVLFLPGLEASRLYEKRSDGSEDQLWEPNGNSDVAALYLNSNGESINQEIYTRDIINTTNISSIITQNIYKSFANMMDELVENENINGWKEYAYDWRQDVNDIVNNGTKYESGSLSLIDTLQFLVDTSKNGKATIVAHSNGGLLAKALLKKLQDDKDAGVNDLIDDVDVLILVASPQIGTASAVPAMLHGYDQKKVGGLLMDESRARELGKNMLSAYGLLPSKEYINHMDASPVTFVDTAIASNVTTQMFQAYGSALNSYTEYKDFLFGNEGRVNPSVNQINLPINLSEDLFSQAEDLHDSIDAWIPPENLRVIEVAGWGLETIASFEYMPIPCTMSLGCGLTLDERPRFTWDGDGTVVVPSAQYTTYLGGAEKYWINLVNTKNKHSDILEVDSLNNLIKSVLNKNEINFDNVLKNSEPVDTENRFRISIHSPVTLDAYDAEGKHTGKVCPPNSNFCYAEENIPNSSYMEFGEGKYLNLSEDEFSKIKLQGTGIGTFTYESEKVLPNGTTTLTIFKDIPVSTQTAGEITTNSTGTLLLKLDQNGDGISETNISAVEGNTATMPYGFSGFLQPINDTSYQTGQAKSVFKAGSTIPVKFQLKKYDGSIIQANTPPVWLTPQKGSGMSVAIDESIYSIAGTSGNTYRWDYASQQYIYNWSTKGLAPGYWYKIFTKLDDGKTYSVTVGLK